MSRAGFKWSGGRVSESYDLSTSEVGDLEGVIKFITHGSPADSQIIGEDACQGWTLGSGR